MNKLPISAIVVGCNEEHLLDNCLQSISFCDELLYVDLESTDSSLAIAEKYTQRIFRKKRVDNPSCEMAQSELIKGTTHDWVLLIDPDERVDTTLADEILRHFTDYTSNPQVGAVFVPWQFYFLGKKLNGTPWGGTNRKFLLIHKQRFEVLPIIHYGRKLMKGFERIDIELNAPKTNVLHHFWMNSLRVFWLKHKRYLQKEGIDRYNLGKRTDLKQLLREPFVQFRYSFINRKGYLNGFVGFGLSLFWAWYQTKAQINLYIIQKNAAR